MFSNSLSSIALFERSTLARVALALIVACAVIFGSGCSLLSDNLDRAAKGAGKVVKTYCENVTIPEIREEVRVAVNTHAAPHSVAIECVDGKGPILKSTEPESVAPAPGEAVEGEPVARLPVIIIERRRTKSVPAPSKPKLV